MDVNREGVNATDTPLKVHMVEFNYVHMLLTILIPLVVNSSFMVIAFNFRHTKVAFIPPRAKQFSPAHVFIERNALLT